MEEGRWSFTFFRSFFEAAQAIDDKEARADFYDAVCQYAITGSVPEDISPIAKALFILAKPNLDVSRKKAEAGSRGGRSAKQDENEIEADKKQDESKEEANGKQNESRSKAEVKQTESKEKANGKRTASDKRIENREERIENRDREDNLTFSDENVCRTKDVRRVQEAWNELGLQKITKILPDTVRGKMLKRRVLEYGVDKVLEAIGNIRGSPFLMGNNSKGWVITFDWFIRPNNFPKVLEGNYSENLADGGTESAKNGKFGVFEVPTQNDYERMKDMLNDLRGAKDESV